MIIKVIIRKEVCMSRGGARPGAGRPKGQGKYNEPTKPIRIPTSMINEVISLIAFSYTHLTLPTILRV